MYIYCIGQFILCILYRRDRSATYAVRSWLAFGAVGCSRPAWPAGRQCWGDKRAGRQNLRGVRVWEDMWLCTVIFGMYVGIYMSMYMFVVYSGLCRVIHTIDLPVSVWHT